jgi:RimJ/RimL family protein N-acetyltransferase
MVHSLTDGTRVVLRPIEPSDKNRLRVALGRLSEDAIRRRFLAAKPGFSTGELSYLTEVDGHNHLALVAVLADDPESIVAVARCVRLPDVPDTAEFAIVVGDPFQRRGLGKLMARALADAARAAGIRRFAATMLSDNVAVRRLMDTFTAGLALQRVDHGVRELVVDLAA